jgi:SNF2 family DNA or RNA helicase
VFAYLESIAGRGRRLPLVARYDGEVSGGDENEPDSVSNDSKFNLPCAPLILIASRKGQEGIDLHYHCRRVVLYDLPWNPALIEQRIGRVHRIGGTHNSRHPVEVIYCYQRGGYEEVIARRIKQRCEMMHALLGAGTWLDQDREVDNLARYRMTFPP